MAPAETDPKATAPKAPTSKAAASKATARSKTGRTRNPERTREDILRVATAEFADKGLSGARIDEIAAKTATTKRMLYYYFGDKEGLYRAVLANAYQEIRYEEAQVDIEHLDPEDAIRAVAEITFDHHEAHPDFIRLVSIENTHRGENLAAIEGMAQTQQPAIETLERILVRGRELGLFRADVSSLDVHILISSYCVFRIANRYTFGTLFDWDPAAPEHRAHLRTMLGDVVLSYLRSRPGRV
ncbi:TetR/AcrR family transcriptional regulator [Rhodococcus sp. NPDC003318]|uniref:TetR/AcrR family transcriptional regulator n=1 Tax=Rhodococcus sp. NPDC003318 TaxID=3364503 RepID=UPI00367FC13B